MASCASGAPVEKGSIMIANRKTDFPASDLPADASDEIALRDLTDAQFQARYQTDRFTASILASRMRYVVKHMSTVMLTTAFSMILRDWYDFAATISGPREMNY